jgi:hypothetical protein
MGIGTGYSCTVPSYDPLAVITNTRRLINGDAIDPMIPWYQGFDVCNVLSFLQYVTMCNNAQNIFTH